MATTSKNPPDKVEPSRLQPLLFEALKSDGSNYLKWSATAEMHLIAEEVAGAIETPTPAEVSDSEKAWTNLLLQKHLDKPLQDQYVQERNPAVLWRTLEGAMLASSSSTTRLDQLVGDGLHHSRELQRRTPPNCRPAATLWGDYHRNQPYR